MHLDAALAPPAALLMGRIGLVLDLLRDPSSWPAVRRYSDGSASDGDAARALVLPATENSGKRSWPRLGRSSPMAPWPACGAFARRVPPSGFDPVILRADLADANLPLRGATRRRPHLTCLVQDSLFSDDRGRFFHTDKPRQGRNRDARCKRPA